MVVFRRLHLEAERPPGMIEKRGVGHGGGKAYIGSRATEAGGTLYTYGSWDHYSRGIQTSTHVYIHKHILHALPIK